MTELRKKANLLILFLTASAYLALGYFVPRDNFLQVSSLFFLLFGFYYFLFRSNVLFKTGITAAFLFRLLLLFATPALSDDYFRFLWDGRLFSFGENPFLNLPSFYASQEFLNIPGLTPELYLGLNSPNYYSVYPPVCQFIFVIPALIAPGNDLFGIVIMRLFILIAEFGSIWLLMKLLIMDGKNPEKVLWYALNPLVVIELTGNLHFEAFMIFFTLLTFYFFNLKQYRFSAIALAFAVCSKLLPLVILPFLFKRLQLKEWFIFCFISGLTCIVLFLPFLDFQLISHLGSSLNLYFQKFEFNASIYYLFREIGWFIYGYNQIASIGPLLSVITFCSMLWLAYKDNSSEFSSLPKLFLSALTIYFLLATIVHPWYITTLVAMAVLSGLRFPFLWSGVVIFSYSAYQTKANSENYWLVLIEYGLLFMAIFLEKRYNFGNENPSN